MLFFSSSVSFLFFLMAGPWGLSGILQNGNPSKWKSSLPLMAAPECHRGDEREAKATLLPVASWGGGDRANGRTETSRRGVQGQPEGFSLLLTGKRLEEGREANERRQNCGIFKDL